MPTLYRLLVTELHLRLEAELATGKLSRHQKTELEETSPGGALVIKRPRIAEVSLSYEIEAT
jgi:hypothetical protein